MTVLRSMQELRRE